MIRLMMMTVALLVLIAGCKEEEPEPTFPPQIGAASVSCEDAADQDDQVVSQVSVEISDPDRDLLPASVTASVNGLPVELTGPDADDVFTWSPPADWDPPMICRGEFRILVAAEDAEGQATEETIVVAK